MAHDFFSDHGGYHKPLDSPVKRAKAALREKIRAKLENMPLHQHVQDSMAACGLLETRFSWKNARSVLFYAPLPGEIDVLPLLGEALKAGKTVAFPRYDPNSKQYAACVIKDQHTDLVSGEFGIPEPNPKCPILTSKQLDLVLVPGVAFDSHGRRLGRGKGFYDQLLAFVRGTKCGVAFDEQIVPEIPIEPHDVRLNCILTPTRWIEP
jgi:5-formyltetrahydrofolate cyclo-ligase